MNRAEKAAIIESLKDAADKASIAVVTDFNGMTVEEMTGLRAKFREVGVQYFVVKNTLARIALTGGPHEVIADKLKDNNAIAFGTEDPVGAAKVVADFMKANPKSKLGLKFASLEGKYLDEAGVKELAKLPSKEQLLGMLLGTMNAVPTNLVSLLANIPRGLLNVLNGMKEKQEAA